MAVLGLILLALCGTLAAGVYLSNTEMVHTAQAFGVSLDNVSIGGIFLVGALTGIVAMLGLSMLLAGLARGRRRRIERKRLMREKAGTTEELARENERLAAELEERRRNEAAVYPTETPHPSDAPYTASPTTTSTVSETAGANGRHRR